MGSLLRIKQLADRLDLWQLKRLDSWLHVLIAEREAPPEEQQKSGRQVVARIVTAGGTMQLELVRCGKSACKSCPHGPYWYNYWKQGGRTRSKYVGKASREQKIQFAEKIFAHRLKGSPVISSRRAAR